MAMFEIKERTVVTEPDGREKTLLPGRVTMEEAVQYGLTSADKPAVEAPAEEPAEAPAAKKTAAKKKS